MSIKRLLYNSLELPAWTKIYYSVAADVRDSSFPLQDITDPTVVIRAALEEYAKTI